MAVNFPDSPTNGDTVTVNGVQYEWNGTVWNRLESSPSFINSDTAPTNPGDGDLWFNTDTLELFVWYVDGTSSQWVSVRSVGSGVWIDDGSNVFYNGSLNVGIGTTTPSEKLDVVGNISASGTINGVDMADVVTKVGTPVDNQIGVWTGDGTIEGDSNLTWDGSILNTGGTGAVQLPVGTTAQQPTASPGMIRYNSSIGRHESYINSSVWERMEHAQARIHDLFAGGSLDDFNVSSYTDDGTGLAQINWSNTFANSTYSVIVGYTASGTSANYARYAAWLNETQQLTGQTRVEMGYESGSTTAYVNTGAEVVVFGQLL